MKMLRPTLIVLTFLAAPAFAQNMPIKKTTTAEPHMACTSADAIDPDFKRGYCRRHSGLDKKSVQNMSGDTATESSPTVPDPMTGAAGKGNGIGKSRFSINGTRFGPTMCAY